VFAFRKVWSHAKFSTADSIMGNLENLSGESMGA